MNNSNKSESPVRKKSAERLRKEAEFRAKYGDVSLAEKWRWNKEAASEFFRGLFHVLKVRLIDHEKIVVVRDPKDEELCKMVNEMIRQGRRDKIRRKFARLKFW